MGKVKQILKWLLVSISIFTMMLVPTNIKVEAKSSIIEKIQAKGELVMGTSADYPPYEFPMNVNGKQEIVGFDVEIGRAIADELGVKLVVKDMSFSGLLAALQSGTIDMVISGMSATPERKKNVDFSVPYFKNYNTMVIKKTDGDKFSDLQSFEGTKLGAQQGSLQEEVALAIDGAQVRVIADLLDLMQDLKNDTVTGVVAEKAIAQSIVNKQQDLMIVEIDEWKQTDLGSSVAIAKGNEEFVDLVNEVVEDLLAVDGVTKLYEEAEALAESQTDESFFEKYAPMILKGTISTIEIAFFGVLFGTLLGLLLTLGKMSPLKILKFFSSAYIELVRGTPMLIQIYIIFYGLPFIGIKLAPLFAGIIAVSLNSAAYVAEIIRAGIGAVDSGQEEAGKALGLSKSKIMAKIILPQATKNILPALVNEFVTIIKESSIVSIIGVGELMYVADTIRGNTYEPFKPLIIVAVIYFILTSTLTLLIKQVERRLDTNVES